MNRKIVAATLIITASGLVNAWQGKGNVERVLLGGYIFMLVLSVLDFFGGGISEIAGALAMVAAVYAILNVVPWGTIFNILGVKQS